jgi:hypothetical protein
VRFVVPFEHRAQVPLSCQHPSVPGRCGPTARCSWLVAAAAESRPSAAHW